MTRGNIRSVEAKTVQVTEEFFKNSDLGACAGCMCYKEEQPHEFEAGRLKIHCSNNGGMVFARTDIESHTTCLSEALSVQVL
jgi:hypothetical protein